MAEMTAKESAKVLAEYRRQMEALTFNDKIPAEQQMQLVDLVCKEVDDTLSSRKDYYETGRKIMEMYEGQRPVKKTTPFEGCADVKTGLTFGKVETLHASLLPQTYNADWAKWTPLDEASRENLENVEKFMAWDAHVSKLEAQVDDYVYNLILERTVVFKIRWDVDFRWVRRLVPKPEQIARRAAEAIKSAINAVTPLTLKPSDYRTTYTFSKFERAVMECPLLDDVGFPNDSIPDYDENKLGYIWQRTYPDLYDCEEKESIGIFINTSKIREQLNDKLQQETRERERGGYLQSERQRMEGTKPSMPEPGDVGLHLIERYGKVRVPGVGLVECIIFVEYGTRTFLGIMPLTSVMRDGTRPWVISRYINRKGRMLGKSPIEAVIEIEDAINSILNQSLDIGTVTILPPAVYRAAAGLNPQEIKLKPGVTIPLDDPNNDFKWMQIPNNTITSVSQIRTLMEIASEVMGIGALQSGQESPTNRSRSTARGTLAIMSKGDVRVSSVATRIRQPLARAIEMKLKMWAQNIPPGMAETIVDMSGKQLFPEGLSAENLAGNYALYLEVDPAAADQETKNANITTAYGAGLQNPMILQNPAALHHLTTNLYDALGDKEMRKILGPPPNSPGIVLGKSVAEEMMMLRHGRIPTTRQGDDPVQLLYGILGYMGTDPFDALEPEVKACFQTRVMVLQTEVAARAVANAQEAQMMGQEGGMGGISDAGGGLGGPEGQPGMAPAPPAYGGGGPAPVGTPPIGGGQPSVSGGA